MLTSPSFASSSSSSSLVQCLEMTTKRKLIGRLVPCRCFRGEEEVISVLDYSHCSLQQVPKEIFSFERTLEELYLDANQIEELPKVRLKGLQLVDESSGVYFYMEFVWKLMRLHLHDDRKQMPFLIRLSFCLIDILSKFKWHEGLLEILKIA